MAEETAYLKPDGEDRVYAKISFTGLVYTEFTNSLFRFMNIIRQEDGSFPDDKPDRFDFPGVEKENIFRRLELDVTIGALDPTNYPDWKVDCEIYRESEETPFFKASESGKVESGSLTSTNITIFFTQKNPT